MRAEIRPGIYQRFVRQPIGIAPLLTFRLLFGALMLFATLRFMYNGWIEALYLEPQFFFKFYGFEWVQPLGTRGMYALFTLTAVAAAGIMLGWYYRLCAVLFFLCFSYIELIDATNYLNHYYLVCLLAFLLIFLPAHRDFSIDVWRRPELRRGTVPAWTINILILQLTIVYTCAGLAKLNPDWLLRAMPLSVWLPEHQGLPLLGYFFQFKGVAFAFSWIGAVYDLTIAWFLMYRKTRPMAYLMVVLFHFLTWLLFNIGLFPFIMIFSTLIFFSDGWHERLLSFIGYDRGAGPGYYLSKRADWWMRPVLLGFIALQLLLPFRFLLYPGHLLWAEEGYRFSWRVMLVEKIGQVTFYVSDSASDRRSEVINGQYLTPFQEKQMSIQPELILQFAHFLKREYSEKYGFKDPVVAVDAHVALNGRTSQPFIDPQVNLASLQDNFKPKTWILPFRK